MERALSHSRRRTVVPEGHEQLTDDERHLAKLGYVQELQRSWSGFSNFAISFSIISILAGCFTSSDLGWNLLVGKQARRRQSRVLHRLAEPDRADRHPGVGRVRLRDVPGPDAG